MFKSKKKIDNIKNKIKVLIDIDLDLANESLDKAKEFVDNTDLYWKCMEDYRSYRDEIRTFNKVLDLIEEES